MKKTIVLCMTAIALAFASLTAATPSFAAGDCPPSELPFYTCVLSNVIPVGGPGGGGGLNLSPRYMMALLP